MALPLGPLPESNDAPGAEPGELRSDAAWRLTRAAARTLQAPAALVARPREGGHVLWCAFGLPGNPRPGARLPLAAALCARVAEDGEPRVGRVPRDDFALRRDLSCGGFLAGAFAAAPLLSPEGEMVGVLVVLDEDASHWELEDLEPLEDLAAGLAAEMGREAAETEVAALGDALFESRLRYQRLTEAAMGGVFSVDGHGRLTEVNSLFATILDRSPDELVGARFSDFFAPEERDPVSAAYRQCVTNDCSRVEVELRAVRPSGERRILTVSAIAVRPGDPGAGAYGVVRDVTEERSRESRFRHAERMASVGPMLSGVCHELNNPLTSIKSFAELMLLDERAPEDREALEIVRREAHRAAKIVSDLRVVARQTQEAGAGRGLVALADVVQEVLVRREGAIRTHEINLHSDLSPDLPALWAVRAHVEAVVLQLLTNAEHAVVDAGGRREIFLRAFRSDAGVAFQIEDTGPGIPEADRDRIFDPFFTTKRAGEGTGLGLSLVRSIVEDHGGRIRVDSRPGHGALFTVELPATEEAPVVLGAPELDRTSDTPLRLLVVDDEAAIRFSLIRYMERRGHEVVEATEGEEALRLLDEAQDRAGFDIILADLRMPGLDGEQLLHRLRTREDGSDQRLIFITGDAESPDAERVLRESGAPVVLKPFELAEIAQIIEAHAGMVRAPT